MTEALWGITRVEPDGEITIEEITPDWEAVKSYLRELIKRHTLVTRWMQIDGNEKRWMHEKVGEEYINFMKPGRYSFRAEDIEPFPYRGYQISPVHRGRVKPLILRDDENDYGGFDEEDLDTAIRELGIEDVHAPIDVVVPLLVWPVSKAAIIFYTGRVPTIELLKDRMIRIKA